MKKVVLLLTGLISFVFLSSIYAADIKIGVVDFRQIMQKSPKVSKAEKDLEKRMQPQKDKIMKRQEALKNMIAAVNRDNAIMRDEEKQKKKDEFAAAEKELKVMAEDFNKKIYMARQETMQSVLKAIEKVAKKNNLNLVLPKGNVLYADQALDVTSQVEKSLK